MGHHGLLNNLVLQRRDAQRALPPVGLRDVYSPRGLCLIRSTVNPAVKIYEVDFKGFSYGFRPGRSPHQALDALTVGIQWKRVNWVLDADIRGFLDLSP